jgi:hypothetical protein
MRHLEQLISKLEQPISEAEAKQGWTVRNRQELIQFFSGLLHRLKDERHLRQDERDIPIVRAMDHYGIIGGEALEDAATIEEELQNLH